MAFRKVGSDVRKNAGFILDDVGLETRTTFDGGSKRFPSSTFDANRLSSEN